MFEQRTELGSLHEPIAVVDESSAMIHVLYRKANGSLQGTEGCNRDAAGAYRLATAADIEAGRAAGKLCGWDFEEGEEKP